MNILTVLLLLNLSIWNLSLLGMTFTTLAIEFLNLSTTSCLLLVQGFESLLVLGRHVSVVIVRQGTLHGGLKNVVYNL